MPSPEEAVFRKSEDKRAAWQSLLASNQYNQIATNLEKAYNKAVDHDDVEKAALLFAARQLCSSCIQLQQEASFHEQAYHQTESRRDQIDAELNKLLVMVEVGSETAVPSLTDSRKNLGDLAGAQTPKPKKNHGVWQRLIEFFGFSKEPAVSEPLNDRIGADGDVAGTVPDLTSPQDLRPEVKKLSVKDAKSFLPVKEQSNEMVIKDDDHSQLEAEGKINAVKTAVPKLVIYCLGQFRVSQDDQQIVNWPSGKGKAVFKYMVANNERPVPRDILMDTFWPNADFEAARNNLNVSIYGLRQAFRATRPDFDHIVFQNDHYQLNPRMNTWIDVEEFERYYQTGQRLEREGLLDKSVEQYEKAKKLYNGDFLEEDLYEDWPILQREGLYDTYLIILDRLTRYYYQHKQYLICIQLCQKMLLKDDCREDAHRRLMRCYYQQGKRTLALRQYKICKEVLAQVLDIPPMPETTSLYKKIRNGEAT